MQFFNFLNHVLNVGSTFWACYLPTCLQYFFMCMGVCLHECYALWGYLLPLEARRFSESWNRSYVQLKDIMHHLCAWKQTQISARAAKCSWIFNNSPTHGCPSLLLASLSILLLLLLLELTSSGFQYRLKTSSAQGILCTSNACIWLLRHSIL